jgi:hydroxyacyl-ACP dehydratase HTD2-like protein with hotdog domain
LRVHAPLLNGQLATKVSEFSSVGSRDGKSGAPDFVHSNIRYLRSDTLCIDAEQTVIDRDDGQPIAVVSSANLVTSESDTRED